MNNYISLTLKSLLIVSMTILISGCATRGTLESIPSQPPTKPGPDGDNGDGGQASIERTMGVKVSSEATGDGASMVEKDVRDAVEGKLTDKGFKVDKTPADVNLSMDVQTELFDKLGNFYRYRGNVSLKALRTYDNELMGKEQKSARGERKLETRAALKALSRELADQSAEWTAEVITPGSVTAGSTDEGGDDSEPQQPRASRYEAAKCILSRSWTSGSDSAYARKFQNIVSQWQGIQFCELIDQNRSQRKLVFRIIYVREAFPAGLLNRMANTRQLNLKPKG